MARRARTRRGDAVKTQTGRRSAARREAVGEAPRTREALHALVREWLEVEVPTVALLDGHTAPMDYLAHAFFDGAEGGGGALADGTDARDETGGNSFAGASGSLGGAWVGDCVVWASRGGGKTFLGALATALEMVFKPGIEVRVLAGSMEQAQRMHAHLRSIYSIPRLERLIDGRITERRIRLVNGSKVELLSQSQASVRGTRVQRLRCDEVELFDPRVWEAAQLTTRSKRCGEWMVRGRIECFSTMHVPHGLMQTLVEECAQGKRRLFKWGVLDVLGVCEAERVCGVEDEHRPDAHVACRVAPEAHCDTPKNPLPPPPPPEPPGPSPRAQSSTGRGTMSEHACPLWEECQGKAKARAGNAAGVGVGHVTIDDAIAMKGRVSRATWESEMLCLRPSRTDAVLPEFEMARHVVAWTDWDGAEARAGSHGDRADQEKLNGGEARRGSHEQMKIGQAPLGARGHQEAGDLWVAGMDFGFRGLTVVLWGVVPGGRGGRGGVLWIVRERALSGQVLRTHVEALRASVPPVAWVGIDPAGNAVSEQTGVSARQVLGNAGLVVRDRRMGVQEGLELVRARLAPADKGPVRLRVHARCRRLIESLSRYHYASERPDSSEPVKDGFDHAVDALRYLVVNLDRPYKAESGSSLKGGAGAERWEKMV